MKKIIFFSKNLEIGGMEKSLVNILNNLSKKYELHLVLEELTGDLLGDLDKSIIVSKYGICNNKNILIRKMINFSKRLLWTIKNFKKYYFSCNYSTYSFWASRLAQVASSNSALYCHSNYYYVFNTNEKDFINFFDNHRLNKFKKLIFVSNESKNDFERIYKFNSNKYVINNLINMEEIIEKAKEKTDDINLQNKNRFIFIGRLDNISKNLDLLLKSFSLAIKKDHNNVLLIVGDGPYYNTIKKYIVTNKLEKNILLLGSRKNPYYLLDQSDCLLLTSNYEGFPVVYNEALCLNKKIITTISVSDGEINISKYAKIVKKNKESIAEAICNVSDINKYKIDINKINNIRLNNIIKMIEE